MENRRNNATVQYIKAKLYLTDKKSCCHFIMNKEKIAIKL